MPPTDSTGHLFLGEEADADRGPACPNRTHEASRPRHNGPAALRRGFPEHAAAHPGDAPRRAGSTAATVRDETFRVLRQFEMTTIFANPGSTEIAFLAGLPDDFEFWLALHEGSVAGMAAGWAIARNRPALVNLHTTAGLANAAGALATARSSRVPLVVVVGQQDRRHLAHQPFLAGQIEGLLGDYPVWTNQPVRPQDVPSAIARAHHEAVTGAGPALVVVPMDDWEKPAEPARGAAPLEVRRAVPAATGEADHLAAVLDEALSPVIVAGAGADREPAWTALVELAERLGAPVWQEPFGARAGYPQDHPLFAGHLPSKRSGVRTALAGHDVLLVVGAPALRQYLWEPGDLVPDGMTVLHVTQYADEAHGSVADVALIAEPAPVCRRIAERVRPRAAAEVRRPQPAKVRPPEPGRPLRPGHVLDLLAEGLPPDTILVEESPSSRLELHSRIPARVPLGYLTAAAGGLGFGLPAAIGVKAGAPRRPVVAVLGDGSSLYGIQALWSAAHYQTGVLFVVLANGRYAIMDRLAEQSGLAKPPWPAFGEIRLSDVARGFGCPARRITTHAELAGALGEVLPFLAERTSPLLLDVEVVPDVAYG